MHEDGSNRLQGPLVSPLRPSLPPGPAPKIPIGACLAGPNGSSERILGPPAPRLEDAVVSALAAPGASRSPHESSPF